jgi:hypothetical protein
MKLSLIHEATVDQVQRRIPHWIKKYFDGDEQLASEIVPNIIAADPTKGKYSEWLVRQWKNKTARFPEDNENLLKNLTLFNQKKSKLEDRDLNNYTPGELAKALDQQFGLTNSERREARKGGLHLPPGAELVVDKGEYKAVKITDSKASSLLCSGTQWCVADRGTADQYLEEGPLYLVYVNGERKYLCHFESNQFMDVHNQEVGVKLLYKLVEFLAPASDITKENNPTLAFEYARDILLYNPFPEGEAAIASDAGTAYKYARDILNARFPAGEPEMFKSPDVAFRYVTDVIKERFPPAEPVIASKAGIAVAYAKSILRGRFPMAEAKISVDGSSAIYYALDIIRGRWPEGESSIASSAVYTYKYAKYALKGRFPAGEATIISEGTPKMAVEYAHDIIEGRWPEAESLIATDGYSVLAYARYVLKGRFPAGEQTILNNMSSKYDGFLDQEYADKVIKGPWPEAGIE